MKRTVVVLAAAMLALGVASQPAEARPGGCLKYGLGGAIVGHFAGGHRWKGAALGCALGIYERRRYQARSRDLNRTRSLDRNQYQDRSPAYGRDRARPDDRDETGSVGGGFGRGGAFMLGGN